MADDGTSASVLMIGAIQLLDQSHPLLFPSQDSLYSCGTIDGNNTKQGDHSL